MIDEAQALNAAFDKTGVKFHDRAAALAAFKEGREITYDDNGAPFAHYDSEIIPLSDALTRFAHDSADGICDRRTLPRHGAGGGRHGTLAKSDLDLAGKIAFIKEHGGAAYESLPLTNHAGSEVITKSDWYRLPRAEKVRRLAADPDAFVKLPNAPATGRVNGSYINKELLAKQKSVRPGGK